MKIDAQKLKTPWSIVFTREILPAYDSDLDVQYFTLADILSTSILHSSLVNLLAVMGIPRYLKGSTPSENPIADKICCFILSLHPPITTWDLVG